MARGNQYNYPKCSGAPAPRLGQLESVTMRYRDGNGETIEVRIDATQAGEIGGVLWDEAFVRKVTGLFRMDRRCRGAGQPRPVRVMKARAGGSAEPFQELEIDSGNCYYHNGMIICC
jgi:hypothetical protein